MPKLADNTGLYRAAILLLDNYDSFTYNLCDYLLQTGVNCHVLRNDAFRLDELDLRTVDGIVLSPGPKKPEDAGLMMSLIEKYHRDKPMLGVCLGHQALGAFFGARLSKANEPMHGKTSQITHNGHWLFKDIPTRFEVMRYHSLLLDSLPDVLQPIAISENGELMALAHQSLPLTGVQFHPESILTAHGLRLIQNWVDSIP